jgi:hypothetical protein
MASIRFFARISQEEVRAALQSSKGGLKAGIKRGECVNVHDSYDKMLFC